MAAGATVKTDKPAARYPRSARALPPSSSANAPPASSAWLTRPFPAADRAGLGNCAGFGHVDGADFDLNTVLPGLRTRLRLLSQLPRLAEVTRIFQIMRRVNGFFA